MEPRAGAAPALSRDDEATDAGGRAARRVTAWRLAATCAALVALAFVQDAGFLVPDTKADLVLDPGRFLERALHLWDPTGAFGQLQNQAYGYLWPMGPFFWVGDLLGAPGWAVQRGWWALVLCTAFLGAALVTRALGVRSDLAVVVAGLAYALSPRMLTVLGPISIEGWPSALAPWVLLPLVVGSRRGDPRLAAALSALAVAMVGGVNAAATSAVLPLGALWLLTRERGPRRRSMMLWWPAFTALGTLWWLVPLFVLGAYSPPFLDFIESASITTYPTTLVDALRGTSNWVPYVTGSSRAGNDLLVEGHLAVMGTVVVALGLIGLLDRRQPHRWFLGLGVLTGLLLVTMGHQGAVQGLLAEPLRTLLDGALAPLRNVHKFDPVLRLPLVVGLGWTVQRALSARTRERPDDGAPWGRTDRAVLVGTGALALVLAITPALTGRLAPSGAFGEVPDYWDDAAAWLAERDTGGAGTTLLVPGSTFGDYLWGRPQDEPMQSLARSDWAVRNQIPLTPPGSIRALDRIEGAIGRGEGSEALTASLRRAGVRWLLVRNDLRPQDDVPEPAVVRQALAGSPGIAPARTFGPDVGGAPFLYDDDTRVLVDGSRREPRKALEVWEVQPAPSAAGTTGRPSVVVGGPEDVMDLEDLGLLGTGASVLAPDVPDGGLIGPLEGAPVVLTDGLRERERNFARVHDGYGPVRVPGEERRTGNPTRDYLDPRQEPWQTTARLVGAEEVAASSSASDPGAAGGSERGRAPYAALDGDPTTQWSADPASTEADRWSVGWRGERAPGEVTLTGGAAAAERQRVRVVTPTWTSEPLALGPGETVDVVVGGDATDRLEVRKVGEGGAPLALAEVEVPDLDVSRLLELPRLPETWGDPDAVVLRADLDSRRGCVVVGEAVRCSPTLVWDSEEAAGMERRFALREAQDLDVDLRVRPRPGPGLADLLARTQPVYATASTAGVPDPRASALAAVDGDPGTAWLADGADLRPTLRLSWLRPQEVTGLRLVVPEATPVARATGVTVRWADGEAQALVDEQGRVDLPRIRSRWVEVEVTSVEPAVDLAGEPGQPLAAGIGELEVDGAASLPLVPSTRQVTRPCGTGPTVQVGGRTYPTSVTASDAALLAGESVAATLCGPDEEAVTGIALRAGAVDVVAEPSEAFEVDSLVLTRGTPAVADEVPATTTRKADGAGTVVPGAPGVLALPRNANPGWTTTDGADPVVVDGWRQGFVLDSGEPQELAFAPDRTYRLGLAAGLLLLAGLGVVTLLLGRRRSARRDLPPLRAARPTRLLSAATAVAAGLLLAGLPGLVLTALVLAGSPWLRRAPAVLTYAVAALLPLAGAAYILRPWGDLSGWAGDLAWPSYLVLVPVLLVLVLAGERRGSLAWRSRMAGRSTTR